MINENNRAVSFPVMKIDQPIGTFYVGKISAKDLIEISWFDVRRVRGEDDLDDYLGIQRNVNSKRVQEIASYVKLPDASFPTAVVLAVEGISTELEPLCEQEADGSFFKMTLQNKPGDPSNPETVLFRGIARVLDGQHRIQGLAESDVDKDRFEVNVCVFVDADISDQASIFATVNLAQTKVNRSLVYDLLSYSKFRSPEKTCHTVTVLLDRTEKSPFYRRIKRLGVATDGRFGEILTQATVVKGILPLITNDVLRDRAIGKRGGSWRSAGSYDPNRLIFRKWFIEEDDGVIADQVMHYFEAVRRRWPGVWNDPPQGNILARTNGFRAFLAFLRPCYLKFRDNEGEFVKMHHFSEIMDEIDLKEGDFNTEVYNPGSSGERALFKDLMQKSGLADYD
jgi:DGQHR domain-containing protein